jgi:hypothetical protein
MNMTTAGAVVVAIVLVVDIAARRRRTPRELPALSEKKAYPLRINAEVLAAAQRWADDELRSLNAQIEYLLRDALRKAGRLKPPANPGGTRDAE